MLAAGSDNDDVLVEFSSAARGKERKLNESGEIVKRICGRE